MSMFEDPIESTSNTAPWMFGHIMSSQSRSCKFIDLKVLNKLKSIRLKDEGKMNFRLLTEPYNSMESRAGIEVHVSSRNDACTKIIGACCMHPVLCIKQTHVRQSAQIALHEERVSACQCCQMSN